MASPCWSEPRWGLESLSKAARAGMFSSVEQTFSAFRAAVRLGAQVSPSRGSSARVTLGQAVAERLRLRPRPRADEHAQLAAARQAPPQ